jgi:hypothetical protein
MTCRVRNLMYRAFLLFVMGVGVCSCGGPASIEGDIVEVQASPDGRAVATLSKSQHGATVPDVYRVYLNEVDSSHVSELVRADSVEGMHIEWSDERTIAVRMQCGKIFQFTNFFYIRGASGDPERVSITLSTAGPCREST